MILRMTSLFVRTLREDPADAEVPSHRVLVRAGYIRRNAPGIYTKVHVQLWRDGSVIKESEFGNYGAFNVTFSTGAPCATGTHQYRASTFGWDGLPTSYPGKTSGWVSITC